MRRRRRCSSRATFISRRAGTASTRACSADSSSSTASAREAGMRTADVAEPVWTGRSWSNAIRLATIAAILIGALVRINVVRWAEPWAPHQPDEHILPLEAVALWEGVTPREVGWPGSTSRLVISAVAAIPVVAEEGREMWQQRARPDR